MRMRPRHAVLPSAVWGLAIAASVASAANLLENYGFQSGSTAWNLAGPVQVQQSPWAASAGDAGAWFRGFEAGSASLSQSVTAPTSGDYVLLYHSKVEGNYRDAATSLRVALAGANGSAVDDLYARPSSPSFRPSVLTLSNVSAGDTLTVSATANHLGGSGSSRSAFVDNFFLDLASDFRSTPLFDGERRDFNNMNALVNNFGGGFSAGSTEGISLQSSVVRSGQNAYQVDLGSLGSNQTKFFQTFATQLNTADRRNTRDLGYFEKFETYVRNDTTADLQFTVELKDHRDSLSHSATKSFVVPQGASWTQIATSLDLDDGWSVSGSPQLDQMYVMSFKVKPLGQATSGSIYLDDARLIEPGAPLNPLTAPIGEVAEALARRTFHGLWGQRSRQSGIVPNTSVNSNTGALNTTSGLLWALPSAVRRGWVSQSEANAYVSQLADTLNHTMDNTQYLPSRFVDLPTGNAFDSESSIDASFIALGLHLYKNQPGLDPALRAKVHETVNRFNFAAFDGGDGWRLSYEAGDGFSGHRYKGYTNEGKTISLAAELSDDHHVDLDTHWHSDTNRAYDYLANPELASLMYGSSAHRAPFSLVLSSLFADMSDLGRDTYPNADFRGNPWHNFKTYQADTAQYLAEVDRPYFFQPDAARGGPPSGYKAYSLYDLHPADGVSNEDLFMPWSATLALLSGSPEAETALRFLLHSDLHGPLGMADGARWTTGEGDPTMVNALQDNWNSALALMSLMRYIDGLESGARFLADLPQMVDALDTVFYDPIPGDYNRDRVVDTKDYEVWKSTFGTDDLSAGGNGDRVIDAADYTIWRNHFTAAQGAAATSAVVPEPSTGLLAVLMLGGLAMAWRLSSHRRMQPCIAPSRVQPGERLATAPEGDPPGEGL